LNILTRLLFLFPLFLFGGEIRFREDFSNPDFKVSGETVSVDVKDGINVQEPGSPVLPCFVFSKPISRNEKVENISFTVFSSQKYVLEKRVKTAETPFNENGIGKVQDSLFTAVTGTNVFSFHSFTNVTDLKFNTFISTRMLRPFDFSIVSDSNPLTL